MALMRTALQPEMQTAQSSIFGQAMVSEVMLGL